MRLVRTIKPGEKIADIVSEAKSLTWTTGKEHALVRLASGERALVRGGEGGIIFERGQISRLFGHTHPYQRPGSISAEDIFALKLLGQRRQYVYIRGERHLVRPRD